MWPWKPLTHGGPRNEAPKLRDALSQDVSDDNRSSLLTKADSKVRRGNKTMARLESFIIFLYQKRKLKCADPEGTSPDTPYLNRQSPFSPLGGKLISWFADASWEGQRANEMMNMAPNTVPNKQVTPQSTPNGRTHKCEWRRLLPDHQGPPLPSSRHYSRRLPSFPLAQPRKALWPKSDPCKWRGGLSHKTLGSGSRSFPRPDDYGMVMPPITLEGTGHKGKAHICLGPGTTVYMEPALPNPCWKQKHPGFLRTWEIQFYVIVSVHLGLMCPICLSYPKEFNESSEFKPWTTFLWYLGFILDTAQAEKEWVVVRLYTANLKTTMWP